MTSCRLFQEKATTKLVEVSILTIVHMQNSVVLYNTVEEQDKKRFMEETLKGLSLPNKEIPLKFVYDEEGCKILAAISASASYYLFNCQTELFKTQAEEMLKLMGNERFNLIDLGAGDACKTKIILEEALKRKYDLEYIPLDISHDANLDIIERFKKEMPELKVTSLTSHFQEGIKWVQDNRKEKNVYIFVGGTIGNGTKQENKEFCNLLSGLMKKGDQIFVGFDKMKDPETIIRAYLDNHHQSQFLLNGLKRINHELGANFDITQFYGFPYFDPYTRCVIFTLVSKCEQSVTIADTTVHFKEAEVIKTGISRKWLISEAVELFMESGLKKVGIYEDSKKYFAHIAFQKV